MLSELMRLQPHPVVMAWVAAQPRATLYTTSANKAEILYGIAALPEGQRRTTPAVAAEAMFTEDLTDRILPFDSVAAVHYAEIVTTRRRAGTPSRCSMCRSRRRP
jgi:predicted nucleic acid-binding protein